MRSFYVHSQRLVTRLKRSNAIRNNNKFTCSFSSSQPSSCTAPTALIFDTETTSKADFKLPPSHPTQPDLVQLGMILVDTSNWTTKAKISILVKLREGVNIDEGAETTHGISKEQCNKFGLKPDTVADIFYDMYRQSDIIVAHNLQFDSIVMEAALHRCSRKKIATLMDENDGRQRICTMHESTELVKIPGKYGKDRYKWPTLSEAYSFVTNEELEGGHDALVDANACKSIFRYLVEKDIVQLNEAVARDDENMTIEEDNEKKASATTDSLESRVVIEVDTEVHTYQFDFGKHKGQQWLDPNVDDGYRDWVVKAEIWRQRANLWEYLYNTGLVEEQHPAIETTNESNSNMEACRLFIGNLSSDTSWQDLKDYFNNVGEVRYSNVAVEPDGRTKGFGFIRYATASEASKAIEKLNGVEFMGRKIEVRLENGSFDTLS